MRDLVKAAASFSWAMALFGARQLSALAPRRGESSRQRFDEVTRAAETQLDGVFHQAFEAGDRVQRSVVDLVFGITRPRSGSAARIGELGLDVVQRSLASLQRLLRGGAPFR